MKQTETSEGKKHEMNPLSWDFHPESERLNNIFTHQNVFKKTVT